MPETPATHKEIENKLNVIIEKLEQIVIFLRIAYKEPVMQIRNQALSDPVNKRILELADGTLSAQTLKKQVTLDTDVSEKTVLRRINELTSNGLLVQRKEGTEIYYETTNLF